MWGMDIINMHPSHASDLKMTNSFNMQRIQKLLLLRVFYRKLQQNKLRNDWEQFGSRFGAEHRIYLNVEVRLK